MGNVFSIKDRGKKKEDEKKPLTLPRALAMLRKDISKRGDKDNVLEGVLTITWDLEGIPSFSVILGDKVRNWSEVLCQVELVKASIIDHIHGYDLEDFEE